jgi:hypothetical protein
VRKTEVETIFFRPVAGAAVDRKKTLLSLSLSSVSGISGNAPKQGRTFDGEAAANSHRLLKKK